MKTEEKLLNIPEFKQSLTTFKFQKLGSSWSAFGSVTSHNEGRPLRFVFSFGVTFCLGITA